MRKHGFPAAAALAAVIATGWTTPVAAGADEGSYWLSGPYAHDKLAVYLIHREGGYGGPVPLTLNEAMQQGLIALSPGLADPRILWQWSVSSLLP